MRLLALSGRRSAALAQYHTCRRLLAEELGSEPARETAALYEAIRDGRLTQGVPRPPRTRWWRHATHQTGHPGGLQPFVAREPELARLAAALDESLAGHGRIVFVTGEAGTGKTMLLREFARRAVQAHTRVVVSGASCDAYGGIGDAYQPFIEVLQLLGGDLEGKVARAYLSREQLRRLAALAPYVGQALVEHGSGLIDAFVPGKALLARARLAQPAAPWLGALDEAVARALPGPSPGPYAPLQSDRAVHAGAARRWRGSIPCS